MLSTTPLWMWSPMEESPADFCDVSSSLATDLIEELVKNGKQDEAIYVATESGLTDRFQPMSPLKCSLAENRQGIQASRDILKKGNHSASATAAWFKISVPVIVAVAL